MTPMVLIMASIVTIIFAIFGTIMVMRQNNRWNLAGRIENDPNTIWREISASQGQTFRADVSAADLAAETTFGSPTAPKTYTFPSPTAQRAPSCGKFIGGLIFSLILAGGGLAAAGFGYYLWREYEDSADWPTAQGQVISATITQTYDSDDKDYDYKPVITYRYFVDRVRYTSDDIDFNFFERSYSNRADAQAVLNKYPEGALVTVIYNPDNPSRAVLERRQNMTIVKGLMFGGIAGVVLGIAAVLFNILRVFRSLSPVTTQPAYS